MDKMVSIIIPVYNGEKYIKECIESCLNQTYTQVEIIVVDDGSTDNTAMIIDAYKGIKTVHKSNAGVCEARNTGIELSCGEYITFVDADDYIEREYIETLVKGDNCESELVICGLKMFDNTSKITSTIIPKEKHGRIDEFWSYRISTACGRMYRKSYIMDNNIRFVTEKGARAEDIPIAFYTNMTAKNIVILPYAGYCYRQHPESSMHKLNENGVPFLFPYKSLDAVRCRLEKINHKNDEELYKLGLLKALANFQYVIYSKANRETKKTFEEYAIGIFKKELSDINKVWKKYRRTLDIPLVHKCAMQLMLYRYAKI